MHANSTPISFVIPNFNGAQYLGKCLESILAAQQEAKLPVEIIVVDNGSTDQSLKEISNFKLQISNKFINIKLTNLSLKIISNQANFGFAKAVNQGVNEATWDWVAVCNNDLILDKNWLTQIQKSLHSNTLTHSNSHVSCLFGLVLTHDGTKIESEGLEYFVCGRAHNISNGQPYLPPTTNNLPADRHGQLPTTRLIWGASASLALYRRSVLLELGGFDEAFFAYEEDVDLALRLHLAGHQTFFVPQAISYHTGGVTSSRMGNLRARMDAKNWFFIILKNYSLSTIIKHLPTITIERLRNLSGLCKQTHQIYGFRSLFYLPKSLIQTYGEVLLNTPKMISKRTKYLL